MSRSDLAHACKALRSKVETKDLAVEREYVRALNMQPQKQPQLVVEYPRGG